MKILCIGSINKDIVYQVDNLATAGETVTAVSQNMNWGGKGLNQAVAAAHAGAEVWLYGCVGADKSNLEEFLRDNGVHPDRISSIDAPTGHAIICVDSQGQNSIIVYGGSNKMLNCREISKVMDNFAPGDLVMLQNETNQLDYIFREAHKRKLRIMLNPSPFEKALLELPLQQQDILVFNEVEGFQMSGKNKPGEILKKLSEQFPGVHLMMTLGEKGAVYYADHELTTCGSYIVDVVDTTAAGDTFTGYFAAGLLTGLDRELLLQRASAAAALTIGRPGAAKTIPWSDEVCIFKARQNPCPQVTVY